MVQKKIKVVKKKIVVKTNIGKSNWISYNDMTIRQNCLADISSSIRGISAEVDHTLVAIGKLPKTFDASKDELITSSKQLETATNNINNKILKLKETIESNDFFFRGYRETLSSVRRTLNKISKVCVEMDSIIS